MAGTNEDDAEIKKQNDKTFRNSWEFSDVRFKCYIKNRTC